MQATLDSFSLKSFTKALTCLSKYGDELTVNASPDSFSLSATNSSKSAYCRFKYDKQFFSRYRVTISDGRRGNWTLDADEDQDRVTGQLLTKSLLSILKHRTVEKSVERCEISIVEAADVSNAEDHGNLESKMVIRLHCKHGVIKTHRLLILSPTSLLAPGVPDSENESRLTIGPKALKDMIEHFPISKGAKADPQLVWSFGESEVGLKSLETSIDSRSKSQLSTELTISADEFDVYDVYETPVTIAFHLREFNATISFADSMSLSLDMRFTDPAAPLFIDVEGDSSEIIFVISTSQVQGAPLNSAQALQSSAGPRKRVRDDNTETPRMKKPMKAALPETSTSKKPPPSSTSRAENRDDESMPPPPSILLPVFNRVQNGIQTKNSVTSQHTTPLRVHPNQNKEPLFLPSSQLTVTQRTTSLRMHPTQNKEPLFLPSSQLSVEDEEILRESGLGVETMDYDELHDMLEGDGEEVAFDSTQQRSTNLNSSGYEDNPDSLELVEEAEFVATQTSQDISKNFHPLFED